MIDVHELTKRYGDTTAVSDLTFSVRPGIVTGFLGPNGSGKSTTMRMILDLAGVRVIVLTTFELDEYVVAAMAAGASGFLDKGVEPDVLLDAIRVVAAGDAPPSSSTSRR